MKYRIFTNHSIIISIIIYIFVGWKRKQRDFSFHRRGGEGCFTRSYFAQTRNNSNESGKCPTCTGWEQRCFYWLSQNNSHGLSNHAGGTTTGQSCSGYIAFISGSLATLSNDGKSCQPYANLPLYSLSYIDVINFSVFSRTRFSSPSKIISNLFIDRSKFPRD